jgi:polar amino acid transport system substrate-binding protein
MPDRTAPVSVVPPERIKASAKLVFLTDIGMPEFGYPPMQFHENGVIRGVDIDLGREVARRMGVEAAFVDHPLETIVDRLYEASADVVICGLTDKPDRRERLTFIHYLKIGQMLMVPAGNPLGIGRVADLSDRTVLVQDGTSNSDSLARLDEGIAEQGLARIRIRPVPGTTGEASRKLVELLLAGEADAAFVDVHNAIWNAQRERGLELAPLVVNEDPAGLACRKDDSALHEALAAAVGGMYDDGTLRKILGRWQLERLALAGSSEVRISG